eukprot:3195233-Rhodomonas_salina.1
MRTVEPTLEEGGRLPPQVSQLRGEIKCKQPRTVCTRNVLDLAVWAHARGRVACVGCEGVG